MSKISPLMTGYINDKLSQIEQAYDVKILLAVESGSRAWGCESKDSDYDVRFIYKHQKEWYVGILEKRDVIELPIVGVDDYSGWDIKKALYLLYKSNPVLFEWINSPIIYKISSEFEMIKTISGECFNPKATLYHYLNIAKKQYKQYLQEDLVNPKKYFYALRPILACFWIEKYKEIPPIEFEILLDCVDDKNLLNQIETLIKNKRQGVESDLQKRIECINEFIVSGINACESIIANKHAEQKADINKLNKILFDIIFN